MDPIRKEAAVIRTDGVQEIEVREGLSPEAFHREYVERNKPVILRKAADEWKHRWTPDMLKQRFGDRKIVAERDELYQNQKSKQQLRLAELLDSVLAGSQEWRVRASSSGFLNEVPELKEDLDQHNFKEQYFPGPATILSNFWISPQGNTSVMHHDTFFENLNCMIHGKKHFVFIPPSDTKLVYPHFMNESPVNPHQPDLAKFPKFVRAHLSQGTIESGDILYIPQFWWHFTTALEPCINLNIWTKPSWRSVRKVLATMPLSSQVTYTVMFNDRIYKSFMKNMRAVHKVYESVLRKDKSAAAPAH
jgi:jumonji domain-containing protein 7